MHVILSGCSGGGKSTLLAELARRGYATVPEPGRRIVQREQRSGGRALPWVDLAAFAREAVAMARADRAALTADAGPVFFDRGLIDAAVALEAATGAPVSETLAGDPPFHRTVFLTPPWRALFASDGERQHGFDEARAEYERLRAAFPALGYETVVLPEAGVAARADLVLEALGL
ncbi:AAA family ATPase [Pelagovum pacificum]|nr:AAA family ATPase [Pelagovum pacificum]